MKSHGLWQGNLLVNPSAPSCAYLVIDFARTEGTQGG